MREEPLGLGERLVTATRSARTGLDTPYSAQLLTREDIQRRSYRNTPQIFRDTPGVMVQETAHGQGSPFVRGFTGFRNVMLIDGIRLNNSVFRDGPNQYWNTIDPLSIERVELVKGPSSVLYGSDAIGGTVNVLTKSPYTYGPGLGYGGELTYRVSSAEHSHIGRLELGLSHEDTLGVLLGGTGKSFGDVEGGRDTGEQPYTGYDEWDADLKVERMLGSDLRLVVAHQHVRQNDVPRTHSTIHALPFEGTTVGSDRRRELDQERALSYVQLHADAPHEPFEDFTLSLSWHEQEEERDRIKSSGSRQIQGFDVGTLGLFAHASSRTRIGRLTYGFEYYHDTVDSFSNENPIQGPVADDASYELFGAFVQDEIELGERLELILGARFSYAAADANSVSDPSTGLRISLDEDWSDVVASVRARYWLEPERLNLFGGVSQGFRAPNLSDLTRFDSARTNEFEVPSPGLDAEHTTSFELGGKAREESFSTQASVFTTLIRDQIQRFPTGNTNASGELEITKDNVGDGHVWGVDLQGSWRFAPQWLAFGQAAFLRGKVDTYPTSAAVEKEEYLDRLPPLTLQAGTLWESEDRSRWGELLATWADDADKLSTRDASDTQRIPPGGTPGWLVLDLRGGWRIRENLSVDLALENLTDEDYRIHGSGVNRPGRSLVIGLVFGL